MIPLFIFMITNHQWSMQLSELLTLLFGFYLAVGQQRRPAFWSIKFWGRVFPHTKPKVWSHVAKTKLQLDAEKIANLDPFSTFLYNLRQMGISFISSILSSPVQKIARSQRASLSSYPLETSLKTIHYSVQNRSYHVSLASELEITCLTVCSCYRLRFGLMWLSHAVLLIHSGFL